MEMDTYVCSHPLRDTQLMKANRLFDNEQAYRRYKIRPRILVDVDKLDMSTEIFGVKVWHYAVCNCTYVIDLCLYRCPSHLASVHRLCTNSHILKAKPRHRRLLQAKEYVWASHHTLPLRLRMWPSTEPVIRTLSRFVSSKTAERHYNCSSEQRVCKPEPSHCRLVLIRDFRIWIQGCFCVR